MNLPVLKSIAEQTSLSIDYSGGLRREEHLRAAFAGGADMISIGSMAVKKRETFLEWISTFGAEKILLGADVREGHVAISGWTESTDLELFTFLRGYYELGIRRVICTDISKDGLLEGASLDLYRSILKEFPELFLIASGGVTSVNELPKLIEAGLSGAIIGKAIYEGRVSVQELGEFSC
jgi:phosphoribosylformimino-5-aminoimidazole carboxamide ribotide isomerase